ncbi:acyltransferase family protein [Sphingomonas sp. MMS24-JH45]
MRALAVLPVVLFHLGSSWFTGGYVGVDIFFVISGFLISGAIAREIELRQFSILAFYAAETGARRILPALFAMMLAVTIAGYVIFMPDEFRDMGAPLWPPATFLANILFWEQVDYFNGAEKLKPRPHTWSLSVEEQFYIFFPLLLIVLSRTRVANRHLSFLFFWPFPSVPASRV